MTIAHPDADAVLTAKLAEGVMGWVARDVCGHSWWFQGDRLAAPVHAWAPLLKIADAWEVRAVALASGRNVAMEGPSKNLDGSVAECCRVWNPSPPWNFWGVDPSAPRALCLAVLKAYGLLPLDSTDIG